MSDPTSFLLPGVLPRRRDQRLKGHPEQRLVNSAISEVRRSTAPRDHRDLLRLLVTRHHVLEHDDQLPVQSLLLGNRQEEEVVGRIRFIIAGILPRIGSSDPSSVASAAFVAKGILTFLVISTAISSLRRNLMNSQASFLVFGIRRNGEP